MSEFDKLAYTVYECWGNEVEFTLEHKVTNYLTPDIRILLVEHDFIEADQIKTVIEEVGSRVIRVHDYQQSLSLIDLINPPDLIIIDINLPYLNAYRLIEYIRNTHSWGKLPIIAIYPESDGVAINRVLQQGANFNLVKPYTREELLNCINDQLERATKPPTSLAA